jgi:hypothetical protein
MQSVRGKAARLALVLGIAATPAVLKGQDALIREMIGQVSAREIVATARALEGMTSRAAGQPGNTNAAAYLHGRLRAIRGISVEYQDGRQRNVVGTLKGTDPGSTAVFMAGAHYDSIAKDQRAAPGATDDAAGCGAVLELARVLSRHRFRHTLKFALWNGEETGLTGSSSYAARAAETKEDIRLYVNFDSICRDPDGRMILDIISSEKSAVFRDMMVTNNSLYALGFAIQFNRHRCGGDHSPFIAKGYRAIFMHQEDHAFQHSGEDTVDRISPKYVEGAARLVLTVLGPLAEPAGGAVRRGGLRFPRRAGRMSLLRGLPGDLWMRYLECGGLTPLSPCEGAGVSRTNASATESAYPLLPGQSGVKPPHSKSPTHRRSEMRLPAGEVILGVIPGGCLLAYRFHVNGRRSV